MTRSRSINTTHFIACLPFAEIAVSSWQDTNHSLVALADDLHVRARHVIDSTSPTPLNVMTTAVAMPDGSAAGAFFNWPKKLIYAMPKV
jgi:hypothetical protein